MKNKVIVITGSSSGIGEACAKVFAAHGSKVVLAEQNGERNGRLNLGLAYKF